MYSFPQMGLEISEEFIPVTPVKTISSARAKLLDIEEKEALENDEECKTPKSPAHSLKQPLVCPPAPRKPKSLKRKFCPPSQGFFQVPDNFESIFLVLSGQPSKKTRASN